MTTNSQAPIVTAKALTKRFKNQTAVNQISFQVWPGEVVGFLGPNGAGKTTTIRMLLNILQPNSGELEILGLNYRQHRSEILKNLNAVSGTNTLLGKLSVRDNLSIFGDLYGIAHVSKVVDEMIDRFQLDSLAHKPLFSLSTGQQVRVAMAKAFVNRPQLLLLDEPTSSLDPDVAGRVRQFIAEAARDHGTTVFITSHNMAEVEKLCSRVLFINKGIIEAEGTPQELAEKVKKWHVRIHIKDRSEELRVDLDRKDIGPYITQLVHTGSILEDITIEEPTLEDFFVHTTRTQQEKP